MAPRVRDDGNSTNGDLSIIPKGVFHTDSFFEDFHSHFNTTEKEILDIFEGVIANIKEFESYKKLQELDFHEGNKAVSSTEDDAHIKKALDVKDFTEGQSHRYSIYSSAEGDVKVRGINENQLIMVEGNVESKDENSHFLIHGVNKSDDITSAIFADGILTVTVPKK